MTGVNRRTTRPPSGGAGTVGFVVVDDSLGTSGTVVAEVVSAEATRIRTVVVAHARAAVVHTPIRASRLGGIRLIGPLPIRR